MSKFMKVCNKFIVVFCTLFINKHLDSWTRDIAKRSSHVSCPIEAVLTGGRTGTSDSTACPLMYRWHGTRYWGAAHGLIGIVQVLLHFPLT